MSSCDIQENTQQVSFTSYPQKNNFVYRRSFCETASHILQVTCSNPNKRFFLGKYEYWCMGILRIKDTILNENFIFLTFEKTFHGSFKTKVRSL